MAISEPRFPVPLPPTSPSSDFDNASSRGSSISLIPQMPASSSEFGSNQTTSDNSAIYFLSVVDGFSMQVTPERNMHRHNCTPTGILNVCREACGEDVAAAYFETQEYGASPLCNFFKLCVPCACP